MYGDCVSIIYTYMKRKTKKECIRDFKNKHGKLYDYSLVEYVNTYTKVSIVCKKHGIFKQTPKMHIRGDKCPKCSGKYKTTNEFIVEAKEVHGNLYDYSLVNYVDATKKIKIICSKHGIFTQRPNDHKNGNGCPGCFIKRAKTNEKFIKESKKTHGDLYDYSMVDYKASHIKVKIGCNIHGSFMQRPNGHLQMNGCPDCAKRGYVPTKGGFLYYLKMVSDEHELYKIGITNGTVEARIKRLYVDKSFKISIILCEWFNDGYIPQILERNILTKYKQFKCINAKSYMKNGFSEIFDNNILSINKNDDSTWIIKEFL